MHKKMIMLVMLIIMISAITYAVDGVKMHNEVEVQEAIFHTAQNSYFTLDKATRDSASAGSSLNAQLVEIKNFPSELLKLKLVGVGKILTGIFILLFGILIALMMMPKRLAMIIKGNQ